MLYVCATCLWCVRTSRHGCGAPTLGGTRSTPLLGSAALQTCAPRVIMLLCSCCLVGSTCGDRRVGMLVGLWAGTAGGVLYVFYCCESLGMVLVEVMQLKGCEYCTCRSGAARRMETICLVPLSEMISGTWCNFHPVGARGTCILTEFTNIIQRYLLCYEIFYYSMYPILCYTIGCRTTTTL
jgi:hypothetical protein